MARGFIFELRFFVVGRDLLKTGENPKCRSPLLETLLIIVCVGACDGLAGSIRVAPPDVERDLPKDLGKILSGMLAPLRVHDKNLIPAAGFTTLL